MPKFLPGQVFRSLSTITSVAAIGVLGLPPLPMPSTEAQEPKQNPPGSKRVAENPDLNLAKITQRSPKSIRRTRVRMALERIGTAEAKSSWSCGSDYSPLGAGLLST